MARHCRPDRRIRGGQAGGLGLQDSVQKNINVYYDLGFEPEGIHTYLETYSKFDPLAMSPLERGRVTGVADLMPFDDYLDGRFYREWARPQGWLDFANAVIEKSGTCSTVLRVVTNKTRGRSMTRSAGVWRKWCRMSVELPWWARR